MEITYVFCDNCNENCRLWEPAAPNPDAFEPISGVSREVLHSGAFQGCFEEAQDNGWTHQNEADLCPDCTANLAEQAEGEVTDADKAAIGKIVSSVILKETP